MAKFDTSEEYDLQIEQFEKTDPVHAFLFNSKFAKLIRSIAYLKKQLETIPPAVSVKGSAESAYRTGEVNISPSNIGLGRVNNTADTEKPVSTAQQAAINAAVSKTLSLGETASTAYAGSKGKALADAMGVLSGLTTSAKNTIVAAINELNTNLKNVVPAGLRSGYVRTGQQAGTSIGGNATAEGYMTIASGSCAHAEGGNYATASGALSHAGGGYTIASGNYQTAIGLYNTEHKDDNSLFIVGNGAYSARSNAFRVTQYSGVYGKGSYQTSGADYAEFFEWADGNTNGEDRRGYFVTLNSKKIKIASPGDYTLGVVSATPVVVGNSDPDKWHGKFLRDDFGNYITQTATDRIPTGKDTYEEIEQEAYVLNPAFDESKDKEYVSRSDRPEWSPIGMLGQLIVRDDGTCQTNGYCCVADGGIATASDTGWRVIERVTDSLVKIIFR